MGWVLRLVETGIDSPQRVIDVMNIGPFGDLSDIARLGLTLAEAKRILARLQRFRCAGCGHGETGVSGSHIADPPRA
jgi:hypothetical protein